jgi:hypothetical protein
LHKDVKETARIKESIEGNVFLQYCEKLWNTTKTNELQLVHNSPYQSDVSINFYELKKVLKLTKNERNPTQVNIDSELYKYASK